MASFPGAIYPVPSFGTNMSDTKTHTTWRDEITDEVRAVQFELGTVPSGAFSTVKARVENIETNVTVVQGLKVAKTGDTMTGSLTTPGLLWAPITLADNQAAYFVFTAAGTRGLAVIAGNASGAGHALVTFRVADSSFALSVASIAPTGGAFVATTGAGLGGTTGTDGNLTVSAHDSLNRLYIENRTGAVRTYMFTFLSLAAGVASGAPVIV